MLIVKIERSWIGPHRVVFKGHNRFYARNSAGKYQMDVSELRSAFTLASSVIERVREFREHRIVKLHDNKTPVTLVAGNRRTILHSIPLESFSRSVQYDVLKYSQSGQSAKIPPITAGSWGSRINLDGFFNVSAGPKTAQCHTRNCSEAASWRPLRPIGSVLTETLELSHTLHWSGDCWHILGRCSAFRRI